MWKIPEIWKDGACIIIGGGPSILKQFNIPDSLVQEVYSGKRDVSAYSPYLSLIHDEHIIAVNMAMKLGNWVDVLFFGDRSFWQTHKSEILKFNGLRVSCDWKNNLNDPRVKVLTKNPTHRQGITFKPGLISWNFNSGAAAINLAIQFGAKKIILLGFDMELDANNNQHWHKYYTSSLKTVGQTMARHLKGFPIIAQDIKGKGIEIINCSPDSKIDCFRKANIWEVL